MNKYSLKYFKCLTCNNKNLEFKNIHFYEDDMHNEDISRGDIHCKNCGEVVKIENGVPNFYKNKKENYIKNNTSKHYGTGWKDGYNKSLIPTDEKWHYDEIIKLNQFPIGESGIGFEAGCGNGKDTIRLAKYNKDSHIIAIDISEGSYITQEKIKYLKIKNVTVVRADLSNIPLVDSIFDWGYSFGVLHHMPNPDDGFKETSRLLRENGKIIYYLYSNLEEKPFLRILLLPIFAVRFLSKRMPLPMLKLLCYLLMPFVFLLLTMPSMILKFFGYVKFAQKIPHHHNKSLLSIYGELYDRMGAQIEYRYNIKQLKKIFSDNSLSYEGNGEIEIWRGHVIWGKKF